MNPKTLFSRLLQGLSLSLALASCSNNDTQSAAAIAENKTTPARPIKVPEAKGSRHILFVGNSHTEYYVSLPDLFDQLCRFNHDDIQAEKIVEMGISLQEIYNGSREKVTAACAQTDADGNYYDYVVLQEKTPVAATNEAAYKASVEKFMADIRKNSPGAVFLIYEIMSPASYDDAREDYKQLYDAMKKTAQTIAAENDNTRLYRVSDAVTAAYEGKNGYVHREGGKDKLRFGENTLHLLNDGGFLAATLLYATIWGKAPAIPEQLPLSTGTDDNDEIKLLPVKGTISNPDALLKIAMENKN